MTLPAQCRPIIGLEIHVQLATRTKLFCGCPTRFGAPPNSQTCPVCTGMPGALPVLNREALRLAIRTGLALDCEIASVTHWDRKNYFYPDLPKGYQISQFDQPVCGPGQLTLHSTKEGSRPLTVRIRRAHLEEDAGKSLHSETAGGHTRIDLNRAGTPLLEIVTEPDLESGADARAWLDELKGVLQYLEVSDCNMEQGSLRVDANVNLRIEGPHGLLATPIVEIKNLNSFRGVERALQYELGRQWDEWQATGRTDRDAPRSTRGWDDRSQTTVLQREKEESADYRYFPDPDLPALRIPADWCREIGDSLPELPGPLRQRLVRVFEISAYDAGVIAGQGRAFAHWFEELAKRVDSPRIAANWLTQDVLRWLGERDFEIADYPVPVAALAELIGKVEGGSLDHSRARVVLQKMADDQESVSRAMEALGIREVGGSEMEQLCEEILKSHPEVVEQIRNGQSKAIGRLIGAARQLEPNVDPARMGELLLARIMNSNPDSGGSCSP